MKDHIPVFTLFINCLLAVDSGSVPCSYHNSNHKYSNETLTAKLKKSYLEEGFWSGGTFTFHITVPEEYNIKVSLNIFSKQDHNFKVEWEVKADIIVVHTYSIITVTSPQCDKIKTLGLFVTIENIQNKDNRNFTKSIQL